MGFAAAGEFPLIFTRVLRLDPSRSTQITRLDATASRCIDAGPSYAWCFIAALNGWAFNATTASTALSPERLAGCHDRVRTGE